jgi:hypothetical protein
MLADNALVASKSCLETGNRYWNRTVTTVARRYILP